MYVLKNMLYVRTKRNTEKKVNCLIILKRNSSETAEIKKDQICTFIISIDFFFILLNKKA